MFMIIIATTITSAMKQVIVQGGEDIFNIIKWRHIFYADEGRGRKTNFLLY
jgi:hypothetical protein